MFKRKKNALKLADFRAFLKKGKWICQICGYVNDGEVPFEQLSEDYKCPVFGYSKNNIALFSR